MRRISIYVRARCGEALSYVAVDSPVEVTDPETLVDLRIGLAFDEPEVREKLAKAMAYVALGYPCRRRHQVDSLAEHLDDNEPVRNHLCTALVVVGCEYPGKLAEAVEPLQGRLGDGNPYVQGLAAEAPGLLAASEPGVESEPDLDGVTSGDDDCGCANQCLRTLPSESAYGDTTLDRWCHRGVRPRAGGTGRCRC